MTQLVSRRIHLHTVERAAAAAVAAWLLLVGVVTHTVLHHVLHALPVFVLVLLPRGRWTSHLSASVAIGWIAMLSAFTPMIQHVLVSGVEFTVHQRAYTWLAPGMVLISAAWGGISLALLRGATTRGNARRASSTTVTAAFASASMVGLAVLLGAVQPTIGPALEWLVRGSVNMRPVALIALAATASAIVIGLYATLVLLTTSRTPRAGRPIVVLHTIYWIFFVAFMIAGLAVSAE